MVTVETGARLHFGFQNLALAHDRLYGGVGVAVDGPRIVLDATTASAVECDDSEIRPFVASAVEALGVDGASVTVSEHFPRHVGLGSGTQLALACLAGIARAHGLDVDPRARAPDLGRGGRGGVGVATFEAGGFVVDAGHPTERFTSTPPEAGSWTVPRPIARHALPEAWRFVLVTPETEAGAHGRLEEKRMRSVVEGADPGIADDVAHLLVRQLLPAVAESDLAAFGRAVARLGRLNGAWYADEQGGVYRPPAGELVERLSDSTAVRGAGQSSWGPTVYGVTHERDETRARRAAQEALDGIGIGGTVRTTSPRNDGASVGE